MAHDHDQPHGLANSPANELAPSPVPREFNHPLLYTVGLVVAIVCLAYLFFHAKQVGHQHARGEHRFSAPAKGGGEPDHAVLMADRSPAVVDRGAVLYGKQCAACHGPQGEPAQSIYRNLKKDPFKNPNGAGPYGLYTVLTKGYGNGMPGFQNLPPEDRYAVAHFVRESFMKGSNPSFVDDDSAEIKKLIPPPGAGAAAAKKSGPEFERDPRTIVGPATLYPLMAVQDLGAGARAGALRQWIAAAEVDADLALKPGFDRLSTLVAEQPSRVARVQEAVTAKDEAGFLAALVTEDGAGGADPVFSLMRRSDLQALYVRLTALTAKGER